MAKFVAESVDEKTILTLAFMGKSFKNTWVPKPCGSGTLEKALEDQVEGAIPNLPDNVYAAIEGLSFDEGDPNEKWEALKTLNRYEAQHKAEMNQGELVAKEPNMVTFPCKIGDTIYEVEEGLPIQSYHVKGFIIGKDKSEDTEDIVDGCEWYIKYGKCGVECKSPISEFGKTLFVTRIQAETSKR